MPHFNVFITEPVTTGLDRFFAVFCGPGPQSLISEAFWDRTLKHYSHLRNMFCPSVRPSFFLSVCLSLCPSVTLPFIHLPTILSHSAFPLSCAFRISAPSAFPPSRAFRISAFQCFPPPSVFHSSVPTSPDSNLTPPYNELLKFMVSLLIKFNNSLRVVHIPGEDNGIADALSRFDNARAFTACPSLSISTFQPPRVALGQER